MAPLSVSLAVKALIRICWVKRIAHPVPWVRSVQPPLQQPALRVIRAIIRMRQAQLSAFHARKAAIRLRTINRTAPSALLAPFKLIPEARCALPRIRVNSSTCTDPPFSSHALLAHSRRYPEPPIVLSARPVSIPPLQAHRCAQIAMPANFRMDSTTLIVLLAITERRISNQARRPVCLAPPASFLPPSSSRLVELVILAHSPIPLACRLVTHATPVSLNPLRSPHNAKRALPVHLPIFPRPLRVLSASEARTTTLSSRLVASLVRKHRIRTYPVKPTARCVRSDITASLLVCLHVSHVSEVPSVPVPTLPPVAPVVTVNFSHCQRSSTARSVLLAHISVARVLRSALFVRPVASPMPRAFRSALCVIPASLNLRTAKRRVIFVSRAPLLLNPVSRSVISARLATSSTTLALSPATPVLSAPTPAFEAPSIARFAKLERSTVVLAHPSVLTPPRVITSITLALSLLRHANLEPTSPRIMLPSARLVVLEKLRPIQRKPYASRALPANIRPFLEHCCAQTVTLAPSCLRTVLLSALHVALAPSLQVAVKRAARHARPVQRPT